MPTLPTGIENTQNQEIQDFYAHPDTFRDTHEIHTSEMRSFQGCRRRWNWAYREGYVLETQQKPLEFGIVFHKAMEVGFNPKTWKKTTPEQKLQATITEFTEVAEEQRKRYLILTGQTKLMEAEGDDYADRIELGIGMLTYYWTQVHPEQDLWFRPVMTEVPFSVPIRNPETQEPLLCGGGNGSKDCGQFHPPNAPVTFDGRIDVIVEDIMNGGYFIWDHKSAASLQKDDRVLHLDPQVGGYSWAAAIELNLDVRGFLYVEYRKDYPRDPAVLKRSYRGRIFSTDKNQATDTTHFIKTVSTHDPMAYKSGAYEEYIAYLKSKEGPEYHRRFPIIKTRKNLRNIGKVIYDIAAEMVSPSTAIVPHVGRFSCSGCGYYQPCLAKFLGEDHTHALETNFVKVK